MKQILLALCLLFVFDAYSQNSEETMEQGNIRFNVSNQGVLFQQNGEAKFEVPKGSEIHSILSSGIWIGGKDSSGNVRVSVATYDTSRTDFQSGPIDRSTGLAALPGDWNYVWKTDSAQVAEHKTLFNNTGYQAPWGIQNWPGSNPKPGNFNPVLAPFVDLNMNQIYEPNLGETPYFQGNEVSYFILNDLVSTNRQGSDKGLGVEIYGMVYTESKFPNVVFVKYRIINRSFTQYDSVFVGVFTDFLLGNPFDNYTATDSSRHLLFAYNSVAYDSFGYGDNPPIMGVKFLRRNLRKSIGFNWDATHSEGWPQNPEDYHHYLNARFKDGSGLMDPVSGQTDFIYLGDPCNGSGWTEYGSSANVPGRRNLLGSMGPISLPREAVISLDLAYLFSQNQGGLLPSICSFYNEADEVQQYWDNQLSNTYQPSIQLGLSIYPNPAHKTLRWELENTEQVVSIQLFDMNGKSYPLPNDSKILDISFLPNGVYYLIVADKQGVHYREKFVKMR